MTANGWRNGLNLTSRPRTLVTTLRLSGARASADAVDTTGTRNARLISRAKRRNALEELHQVLVQAESMMSSVRP